MNRDLDPRAMAVLDEEREYLSMTSRASRSRRIQIPKGHEWLIRFLPVELGSVKTPWARFGFHWINKRPYMCVNHTSPYFGGIKDGECQLCSAADQLNDSSDREVSLMGYKARAVPQWLMYSLVLEKNDGQRTEETRGDDLWTPWEFWLHRSPFDEINLMHRNRQNAQKKKNPDSPSLGILDFDEGCNIKVRSVKQGLKFDREDPSPLMTDDPIKRQALVDRIWSKIKFKDHAPPSRDEMDELVSKLREAAERGSFSDDRLLAKRGSSDYYDDDRRGRDDDRPARAPARDDDRPATRSEARDDDHSRPVRRDEPRDNDRPRPARDEDDRPRRSETRVYDDTEDTDLGPVRPSVQRTVAPPVSRSVPPPPARRESSPPPASIAQVQPRASVSEDDNVPDERVDHAPPQEPAVDEAPPTPVTSRSTLSSRIRNGINAVQDRR